MNGSVDTKDVAKSRRFQGRRLTDRLIVGLLITQFALLLSGRFDRLPFNLHFR
jgi:hypothetical protein